jgi:hypothetical protein
MTELSTGNGHDRTGGLAPPVQRPKDPTGALRQRRARARRRDRDATTAQAGNQNFEKTNDFKGSVTVATVTNGRANHSKTVTPFAQPQWQAGGPVTVPKRYPGAAAYAGAVMIASVGITLSAVGMVETATYALAAGGVLLCALAVAADVLTLTMPSVIGALWRRRSPAVVALAGLLWCAGAAVTVANLAGYVGEHVEQYQNGRETLATGRSMALERLARLKDERKAIAETRGHRQPSRRL